MISPSRVGSSGLSRKGSGRRFVENRVENRRRGGPGKGLATRGHLVQHHPERIDVRPCVELFPQSLLRRHVGNRPHDARARQVVLLPGGNVGARASGFQALGQLGEPKVENLDVTGFRREQIGGFDISMNDASGMSRDQSLGHGDRHLQKPLGRKGPAADLLSEGPSLEKLHHEVRPPLVLAEIVESADVGVIEGRRGSGFPLKPFESFPLLAGFERQELDRYRASEASVLGAKHLPLPPRAELLGDAVMPYDLAKQPSPPRYGSSHRKDEHIRATPKAARFVRRVTAPRERVLASPFPRPPMRRSPRGFRTRLRLQGARGNTARTSRSSS